MKAMLKLLPIGLFAVLILNACSIEKRKYQSGFNIEWNGSGKSVGSKKFRPGVPMQTISLSNHEENLQIVSGSSIRQEAASTVRNQSEKEKSKSSKLTFSKNEHPPKRTFFAYADYTKSMNKTRFGSESIAQNGDKSKKEIGFHYKILGLLFAGMGIQKLNTAIRQRNSNEIAKRKSVPGWFWVLMVLLIFAMFIAFLILLHHLPKVHTII